MKVKDVRMAVKSPSVNSMGRKVYGTFVSLLLLLNYHGTSSY